MIFITLIILIGVVLFLLFLHCRDIFKIAYYETKLKNNNINIENVKNLPIYKLWLN